MSSKHVEEKIQNDAISFFKNFLKSIARGRFRVVHFGWWGTGQKGKYGVSMYFNNLDETE